MFTGKTSTAATTQNTGRFDGRAKAYAKHRPSFPPEVTDEVFSYFKVDSGATILDLGSGTAIVSDLVLRHLKSQGKTDIKVIGLEPNEDMRLAGDEFMKETGATEAEFRSVGTPAENTELPAESIDVITIASTFHWLDGAKTRAECLRILKDHGATHGGVAIMENQSRNTDKIEDPNLRAYNHGHKAIREKHGATQTGSQHHATMNDEALGRFFGPKGFVTKRFPVPWNVRWETLKGVFDSDSTVPNKGSPNYEPFYAEMEALFKKHEGEDGKINFVYDAVLYYGHLSS